MPACAIEMCMDISQEPLYARINTKKSEAQGRDNPVICEPAQSKCTWPSHKSHLWRICKKNAGPQGRDSTLTHIWRERAQSKCTWTSQKNIFMQESAGKKPGPRSWPHTFYKPAQSTCNGHLTRATLCENFQEKCRVSKPGKTRGADRADFVRACAIKMGMDISQEQFYARI